MKNIIILGFLTMSILFSGCINSDTPVISVNVTFIEKDGIVEAEHYTLTQTNVSYMVRPKKSSADSFPAIAGRTTMFDGKNTVIGPWETLPYKGNGTYTFNIGFDAKRYPKTNDMVHITIMVVDSKGERIGYIIKDTKWE